MTSPEISLVWIYGYTQKCHIWKEPYLFKTIIFEYQCPAFRGQTWEVFSTPPQRVNSRCIDSIGIQFQPLKKELANKHVLNLLFNFTHLLIMSKYVKIVSN